MKNATIYSDQFEWTDQFQVTHQPTGAWFTLSYPNSESDNIICNWGCAGEQFANGDVYEKDELLRMAWVLLDAKRRG